MQSSEYRVVKHGNIFVVEGRWEDSWLPIGIYKHAGAAQATVMGLVKGRERIDLPEIQPEVVWTE